MRRSVEEQIDAAIEDTEYGTLAPTVECASEEEFQEMLVAYEEAQYIRETALTQGWFIIQRRLVDEANRAANDLLRVVDTDDIDIRKKKSKQQQAAHARDFVINMVQEAEQTPRPIKPKTAQSDWD